MARLCNTTAADVQSRRKEIVCAAARVANAPAQTQAASISQIDAEVDIKREQESGPRAGRTQAASPSLNAACTILLKGAGTLVCDGSRIFTNKTGNPGMATGGSGDVLTGIIAALVGQGMTPFDAAVLGAHVHGLAGDLTARVTTQTCLIATDLIQTLPRAFG
ncbi:MAG: NAD(P)H-hydrate dehydratase [Phycisphaerales bacterium]|nr:NAD(P)H-hydrate dehydratase [Phycisphaerales bacterium]MCB9857964.1 NAD(P)H-hydrate dehydratase [Phycisphaerales bacterium]MCB9864943.1 NAD(P)H-hydrate dehydratase [Phycisphaerales bacterium]